MNKTFLFLMLVLMAACQSPNPIYRPITPPAAYLQLSALPVVPHAPASNLSLLNYLFSLHDYSIFCKQQIEQINLWSEKVKK